MGRRPKELLTQNTTYSSVPAIWICTHVYKMHSHVASGCFKEMDFRFRARRHDLYFQKGRTVLMSIESVKKIFILTLSDYYQKHYLLMPVQEKKSC